MSLLPRVPGISSRSIHSCDQSYLTSHGVMVYMYYVIALLKLFIKSWWAICFQLKQIRSTVRLMTFTGTNMLVKPITVVKLDKPLVPKFEKSNEHWAAERR